MLVNSLQSENTLVSIVVTLLGIFIFFKDLQFRKVPYLIISIPSGMFIFSKLIQSANANLSILITPFGISISFKSPQKPNA